jgi:hypothetical protein
MPSNIRQVSAFVPFPVRRGLKATTLSCARAPVGRAGCRLCPDGRIRPTLFAWRAQSSGPADTPTPIPPKGNAARFALRTDEGQNTSVAGRTRSSRAIFSG